MNFERILIIGHSGYIGGWVGEALTKEFPSSWLFGISRSAHKGFGSVRMRGQYVADLRDVDRIEAALKEIRPDAVVHLASLRSGKLQELLGINAVGFSDLLSRLGEVVPQARIVVVGSAAELGTAGGVLGPLKEDALCEPVDAYGITKLAQSGIAHIKALHGQDIIRLRVFNVIGPAMPESLLPGRCARLLRHALQGVGPVKLRFGPLFTERDYVDVRDVARAVVFALSLGHRDALYHIGSGQCRSGHDLVRDLITLSGALGVDWWADDVPQNALVRRQIADFERAFCELGWRPTYLWQTSLKDLWSSMSEMPVEW